MSFMKFLLLAAFLGSYHLGFADPTPFKAQPGASSVVAPGAVDEQVFLNFLEWTEAYLAAETLKEKSALEARGLELARARRGAMFQYIVFDPQRAFDAAIPMRIRQQLPEIVVAELEKRLSGRSEFAVLVAIYVGKESGQNKTRVLRSVVLDGKAYHASVYGHRLGVTTKKLMAWHGIALDNYIALYESPMRLIEPGETLAPNAVIGNEKRCPVCGNDVAQGLAVDVGGVIYYFDEKEHFAKLKAEIEEQENIIGPDLSGLELLEPVAKNRNQEN